MDCTTFASLMESVRQVVPPMTREIALSIARHATHPWWRFNTPRMDYTASPDWYAGAV